MDIRVLELSVLKNSQCDAWNVNMFTLSLELPFTCSLNPNAFRFLLQAFKKSAVLVLTQRNIVEVDEKKKNWNFCNNTTENMVRIVLKLLM